MSNMGNAVGGVIGLAIMLFLAILAILWFILPFAVFGIKNCGIVHKIFAMFKDNPTIRDDFLKRGLTPFPNTANLLCKCGQQIDLSGTKAQIESQTNQKIL